MKERKVIIKTGFNLENSYARLPEKIFLLDKARAVYLHQN